MTMVMSRNRKTPHDREVHLPAVMHAGCRRQRQSAVSTTGHPLSWCPTTFMPWPGESEAEACPPHQFLVESLGISLPCQVMHADLRMACTAMYRSCPLLTARYSTWAARPWLSGCHEKGALKLAFLSHGRVFTPVLRR